MTKIHLLSFAAGDPMPDVVTADSPAEARKLMTALRRVVAAQTPLMVAVLCRAASDGTTPDMISSVHGIGKDDLVLASGVTDEIVQNLAADGWHMEAFAVRADASSITWCQPVTSTPGTWLVWVVDNDAVATNPGGVADLINLGDFQPGYLYAARNGRLLPADCEWQGGPDPLVTIRVPGFYGMHGGVRLDLSAGGVPQNPSTLSAGVDG